MFWKRPISRVMLVAAIFLAAAAFRFHALAKESFWLDEALTALLSDGGVSTVLQSVAVDAHPPLYFLGLYEWRRAAGDSDAALRAYSAAWSLLGLAALFLLARDIGGGRAGLIALVLGAVNPHDVYFAQEARMYAQTTALGVWGSWCLWRWILAAEDNPRLRAWAGWALGYAVCAAAALGSHYMGVTILLAQGLFGLWRFRRRRLWACAIGYLACALAAAVVFLPWLLYVCHRRSSLYCPGVLWIPRPPISDLFSFLGREFMWGALRGIHDRWWIPTLLLPGFVLSIGFLAGWRIRSDRALHRGRMASAGISYLAWLIFVPPLLAFAASYVYHPVYFRPRFSLFVLPPFLALAGVACASLGPAKAWIAVAPLFAISLAATIAQDVSAQEKEDWRVVANAWPREESIDYAFSFLPYNDHVSVNRYLAPRIPVPAERIRDTFRTRLPFLNGKKILVLWSKDCLDSQTNENKAFAEMLFELGPARQIPLPKGMTILIVTAAETRYRVSLEGSEKASPPIAMSDEIPFWIRDAAVRAGWWDRAKDYVLADVDGDGSADLAGFDGGAAIVALAKDGAFSEPRSWFEGDEGIRGELGAATARRLADVNGDGKADLVGFAPGGVWVAVSTGSSFAQPVVGVRAYGERAGSWSWDRHPRALADVNGDGTADIVGFGGRGVFVSLSTGEQFLPPAQWSASFGASLGWRVDQDRRVLADVNGDAKADIVAVNDYRTLVALSTGTEFSTPVVARLKPAGGWPKAGRYTSQHK